MGNYTSDMVINISLYKHHGDNYNMTTTQLHVCHDNYNFKIHILYQRSSKDYILARIVRLLRASVLSAIGLSVQNDLSRPFLAFPGWLSDFTL